mmetsp:Transcript_24619/g.53297  ORF Transcript_24619/g.53297 Transcript_24619/m.53297 type:complete len:120 (-) Transcript_24619:49-408(-)
MSSSDVFGLAPVDTPTVEQGSVLVEWLYNGEHGDTHECPRRQDRGQEQLVEFLESGQVQNTCHGPCVSEHCGFPYSIFWRSEAAGHEDAPLRPRPLWISPERDVSAAALRLLAWRRNSF